MRKFFDKESGRFLKKCPKCRKTLFAIEFNKNRGEPDGFSIYCGKCESKRQQKYYGRYKHHYYDRYKNSERYKKRAVVNARKYKHKRKHELRVFIKIMYNNMYDRVNNNRRPNRYYGMDLVDRGTFEEFAKNTNKLNVLFNNWREAGHIRELMPSIDRVNNSKGYITGNMQFLTLAENIKKGAS